MGSRHARWLPSVALVLTVAACGPSGPVVEPPAAPSNVAAAPGPGYVHVTWQDESTDETGFAIYRELIGSNVSTAQAATKIGETDADAEAYLDGDVTPGSEYSYSVSAVSANGESDQQPSTGTSTVPVGIGAMVGAVNSPSQPFTALVSFFSFPTEGFGDGDVTIQFVGPPGWNSDSPASSTLSAGVLSTGWFLRMFTVPPVSGDYTVTVTAGAETYKTTANLPDNPVLYPMPSSVTVTGARKNDVSVEWTMDDEQPSYLVQLLDGESQTYVGSFGLANDTAHVLDGLVLDAGIYEVAVGAFPLDLVNMPMLIDDFGFAFMLSDAFTLSHDGIACIDRQPIVDPVLAALISQELGLVGSPSCTQLASLTELDVPEENVTNLAGIQFSFDLTYLGLDNNALTDLGPVASLSDLDWLWLGGNPVTDLAPIADLSLRGLSIWGTQVSAQQILDIVSGQSQMERLYIGSIAPSDMGWLTNLPQLFAIGYEWAGVQTIPDLSSLSRLHEMFLQGNELSDPADLERIVSIYEGRTPEEGDEFVVYLEENYFDLSDPDVQSALADLAALGVAVTTEPQRVP